MEPLGQAISTFPSPVALGPPATQAGIFWSRYGRMLVLGSAGTVAVVSKKYRTTALLAGAGYLGYLLFDSARHKGLI